ncbi:MAG: dihydroorotate dehydrogenase electron transfer subunit [Anaerolineae bacterium]
MKKVERTFAQLDNLPQPAKIGRVIAESAKVKTFILEASLEAEPGQFVMIWLPRVNEKPFSLVNAAPLTLTVARVGPFTGELHELRAGDRLWFRGPLGRGFELAGENLLLVGGGYGVAPLAFLARRAREAGCEVTAVIGAQRREDLIFESRFAKLGCRIVAATEDGSAGVRGLATHVADDLLSWGDFDAVYTCGPEAMLDRLAEMCMGRNIPCQLSREGYMRCGLGICGSCQRDGMLVCRDGPVFTLPIPSVS